MVPSITGGESRVGQFPRAAIRFETPIPSVSPITPPTVASTTASVRNWKRMSRPRPPTAMRMPISRVRSVTETSITLAIPMPPTMSEIAATASSSVAMVSVLCFAASLHLRQVADLEIGLRLVGEAVPLAEQKERIEAARITAGASEPQLSVADGLSEVASVPRAIRGGAEARQKAHNDRTALRRKALAQG